MIQRGAIEAATCMYVCIYVIVCSVSKLWTDLLLFPMQQKHQGYFITPTLKRRIKDTRCRVR